jgi:2-polyprenyl-3-methyl-5-hydroxy-6-metoxy-1,4-benzoquinol methylase
MQDLKIDPNQYDNISWEKEGAVDSPSRKFFRSYLEQELGNLDGKAVLDVGSGVGQLFPMLKSLGAEKIVGVEPSEKNFLVSKKFFPDIEVVQTTFENFESQQNFDRAIFLLSVEHVTDLDLVFSKTKGFLSKDGQLIFIAIDKDYEETPRFNYKINKETIDEHTSIVSVDRNGEKMVSIARSLDLFIRTGDLKGFSLEKIVEMKPTEALISEVPKYEKFRDTTICHLMKFKPK